MNMALIIYERDLGLLYVAVKKLDAFKCCESQKGCSVLCRPVDCTDHENTFYRNRFVGHILFLL